MQRIPRLVGLERELPRLLDLVLDDANELLVVLGREEPLGLRRLDGEMNPTTREEATESTGTGPAPDSRGNR